MQAGRSGLLSSRCDAWASQGRPRARFPLCRQFCRRPAPAPPCARPLLTIRGLAAPIAPARVATSTGNLHDDNYTRLTAPAATSTNNRHGDNYTHKAVNIGFSSSNATRSGHPGTSPGARPATTPHPPAAPSPRAPHPCDPPAIESVGGKGLAARDTARSGGVRRPLLLWAAARIRVLLPERETPQVTFRAWPLLHTCRMAARDTSLRQVCRSAARTGWLHCAFHSQGRPR